MTAARISASVCLLASMMWAEDSTPAAQTSDPYAAIRAAMQASIEKQKASVRNQVQHANAPPPSVSGSFFTVPWPSTIAVPLAVADCDPMPAAQLDPLIDDSAKRHGVKAEVVRAVIQKESGAKPCALSVKGAQGLMQLMPATAADYGVADPFDPKQNVDAGTRFLKTLLDRFKGDLALALGAYNAGPGAVEKAGGIPRNAETKDYVSDITTNLSRDSVPSSGTQTSPGTKGQ